MTETIFSGSSIITTAKKIWYGPFSDSNSLLITKANTIPTITSVGTATGYIPINYTLENSLSKTSSIKVYYSIDKGVSWVDATRYTGSGDGNTSLSTSPSGTAHSFYWNSYSDLGIDFVGSVLLKIISYDRDNYIGDFIETNYEQILVNNAPYAPTLISPIDGYFAKDDTPEFVIALPNNPNPPSVNSWIHALIEVDTSANFHGNDLSVFSSQIDRTGWQYQNESDVWTDFSEYGLLLTSELIGKYVRLIVQTNAKLPRDLLYWRASIGGMGISGEGVDWAEGDGVTFAEGDGVKFAK